MSSQHEYDSGTSCTSTLGTTVTLLIPISSPSLSSFKPIILRNFRSDSRQSVLKSSTSCNWSRHVAQQLCGNLESSAWISISDTRQKASARGRGLFRSLNIRTMALLSKGLAQTRHREWTPLMEVIVGDRFRTGCLPRKAVCCLSKQHFVVHVYGDLPKCYARIPF
uniref:(northern house mosquito) hypothetical protein n=1 Tax=Culex pipiens TaxID=7175 RepID=A0A8D8C6U9_CULPI